MEAILKTYKDAPPHWPELDPFLQDGKKTTRIRNEWILPEFLPFSDGLKNPVVEKKSFSLLKQESLPNELDYFLRSLAACLTSSVVYYNWAMDFAITRVETVIEVDIPISKPDSLSSIKNLSKNMRLDIKIEGDLTDAQKFELISHSRFSPAFDLSSKGVFVNVEFPS